MARPLDEVNKNLTRAVELIKDCNIESLRKEFKAEPLDIIGSCLRSAFRAKPGHKLVICDLSAIENRVLGYICKAPSILKVFEENLDPYKYFAVDLYHKKYEEITKLERQNAKPPVLGCLEGYALVKTELGWKQLKNITTEKVWDGKEFVSHSGIIYQGKKHTINVNGVMMTPDHSVKYKGKWIEAQEIKTNSLSTTVDTYDILNAGPRNQFMILTNYGPLIVHNCGYGLSGGEEKTSEEGDIIYTGLMKYGRSMGIAIDKALADRSVEVFRKKHWEVVNNWEDLDSAAKLCIRTGKPQNVNNIILFELIDDVLRATLPSGRSLHYLQPKIVDREWFGSTKKTIEYWGMNQEKHQYGRIYTYGSKLLENFDQSISRDLLVHGMKLAESKGLRVIMHTHDELVAEVPINSPLGIKELRDCMIAKPSWANDHLILDAAGFVSDVYRKE